MNVEITSLKGSDNVSPETFNELLVQIQAAFSNIKDYYASLANVNTFKETATFEKNVQAKGDIVVTGEIYTASDERIKTDFKEIENALEKLKTITPYTYIKNGKVESGVKAQALVGIMDECVMNVDGVLMVRYDGIIPYLICAVRELEEKINNK